MGVKIKDIPINDRPVERLANNGVETLTNDEVLAIILKTGIKGLSSKELASSLISSVGGIKGLSNVTLNYLEKFKGIGKTKACNLIAALELGKRVNKEVDTLNGIKLNNSEIVYKFFKNKLGDKKQEYFYCVYLDVTKRVITDKLLFIGTLNYSMVHPREVFKEAYLNGASALICVHNHPSGNTLPSKQDLDITNSLINVGNILGIKVVDHIIIGKNNYYSFLENEDICG